MRIVAIVLAVVIGGVGSVAGPGAWATTAFAAQSGPGAAAHEPQTLHGLYALIPATTVPAANGGGGWTAAKAQEAQDAMAAAVGKAARMLVTVGSTQRDGQDWVINARAQTDRGEAAVMVLKATDEQVASPVNPGKTVVVEGTIDEIRASSFGGRLAVKITLKLTGIPDDGGLPALAKTEVAGITYGPRVGTSEEARAAAKRVVFVVDTSASMLDTLDFVKLEVAKSVNALGKDQAFAVLVVSDQATFAGPAGLQLATDEGKKRFAEEMKKVKAEGINDDVLGPFQKAFEKAMTLKPTAILFFTDGRIGDDLPGVVRAMNAEKKVRVDAVAFLVEDAHAKERLLAMVKENGGECRFVGEKDLGK